jgi:chromosome segregation protein
MYFKQLDLFGFKSFARKTTLKLEPGVSAIVGPNGCGKSNIADAIRWVLGEQKMRVLRGQHMEDVIFSGSDDRPPLGMSEVTLTLDNSDGKLPVDYSEVSVTRKLFRTGESEYYTNKIPCRRKDIIELFLGTGIGPDSYSLIEQGRIDLVLSSKPDERRYIFEDAAGIIKYKSRKDAAIRKMERADANLLRLQDTIIEIRRRINSLRRQASAAQRYRRFQDELRSLELRLALLKYGEQSAEHTTLATSVKELGDQLEQVTTSVSSEESYLEKTRLDSIELDKTLFDSRDQSRDYQSQIEKKESQIAVLREKISAIDSREKRDLAEIQLIQRSLEELHSQRLELNEKERDALQKASQAQQHLSEKENQLTILTVELAECEENIEQLRSTSLEKLDRKVSLQNELGGIETNLQVLAKRVAKLSERKAQVEQSVTQHENRLGETRRMIDSLRAALASLSSDLNSLTEAIASKETELETSIAERDSIRDSLSAARSKLSSLEELRDRFEGYEEGVRAVMFAKQEGAAEAAGVIGTLADLIHTGDRNESAVEAALGHMLQHIVVEDTEAAKLCAALLDANPAGRASFIPLSSFRTNGNGIQPLPLSDSVLGVATDLISCDEKLRPVAIALMGSTLVVDSLETALSLAPTLGRRCDIVTLGGEKVSSLGIITTGASGQSRGLLGRKNEIEELKTSVAEMVCAIEAENHKIDDLKEDIDRSRESLQRMHSAINSHEVELAKAERDRQQLDDNKRREEEEHDVLSREESLAVHENRELTQQRQELMQQIEHARKIEAEIQEQLKDASLRWNDLRQRKDTLASELTDFKVSVSSLQLTCETYKHNISRLENESLEADRRIAEKRQEIAEGEQEKEAFTGEIEECRSAIQALFETKQTLDAKLEKIEDEKRQLTEKIQAIEDNLKQLRARMQDLGEKHHQAEISLAHTEEKISFLKEKTMSDYHLSMSEIGHEITVEEDFDREAADHESQRLRGKIESMGSVNLIAIEEFEELQQRYDLLIQQETDLRKAKETLIGIIKKINKITQHMFLETFEQIRSNFHDIFRHLFGGGRANIHLIDPANPLESGIEISVHPPGKKAQSISLLSGGEKALTAVSLLFAIFRTKPSPFCVLDEVDAPLDDSNILRFIRLVQMFSHEVQFIIVTHNKRTMELADVLYGVTMEQRGVSQIVSVKLKRGSAFEFVEPSTESNPTAEDEPAVESDLAMEIDPVVTT